ncbi:MAG: GIY-YIG nuclease family protein [candidate division Zixibacteria bacterium]|nr:GIY-YIG nuclease family protein [candidate division Zixibacteria bacterium]
MTYWVYVLQSKSSGRFYCGHTGNLTQRIEQHNDLSYVSTKTTKRFAGPWVLVHSEEFETRSEAMKVERQIKKRGMRRYLESKAQL